jgi:ParB family transcriptional regulator, chromosome partitioning protein
MGLSALLGAGAETWPEPSARTARTVPIELLRPSPFQPRRSFDEEDLEALTASIRARGVMQPLLVRGGGDGGGQFEIVAGERRWRAAQRAGLHELPVIVLQLSDREALEVALVENVQRQDLSPLEEAEGYRRLIDEFGHTQEELASTLGKSRSHLANLLRLLGLPEPVRRMLEAGELSAGHARALLTASDPLRLAAVVVARGLNVRQTEKLVQADTSNPVRRAKAGQDPNTLALERDLAGRLGLDVAIRPKGSGGSLTIAYHTLDQLDDLLRRLR